MLIGLLLLLHFWVTRDPFISTEPVRPQFLDSLTQVLYPAAKLDTVNVLKQVATKPVDTSQHEFSQPPEANNRKSKPYRAQSIKPKDLNQVDSIWLMQIYGIGPVLSKRIIKYRNLLGGFHSMDQLNEVYNLPEETIEKLKQYVFLDSANIAIERISINATDFMQIAAHPYISYILAKAIVSYREQHGPFNNLEDLKNIHLMDDSTYLRVLPYIDF